MKFIVDAQLPRRLAHWLRSEGYDTLHTLDLPEQNKTADNQINRLSTEQQRIVISKDSDFYDLFLAQKQPYKLLFLTVGNCPNSDLIALFAANMSLISELLAAHDVIQMSRSKIIVIC